MNQRTALMEGPPGTAKQHADLLEAIWRHDLETAKKVIVAHFENIERRFSEEIEAERERLQSEG